MLSGRRTTANLTEQIAAVLLLLLSFLVLCYRLDAVPMFLWDESRQANNALEMAESGQWAYTTYDGKPDFWNTKPHLLILLQALCMKVLGPGLLALRLPSAVAGCMVLLTGFRFLFKRYGFAPAAAWIAVMLGCGGFNTYHVVRTGDYDALLTLFLFLATLSLLKYLENSEKEKHLSYTAVWFTAALLTKGIAAAMWLPCWFAMAYFLKPLKAPKMSQIALSLGISLFAAVLYYGLHEWLTPGYLNAVFENEFSGRYLKPNEGHNTYVYYYAEVLWSQYFKGFIVLLPIALFMVKTRANKRLSRSLLSCILVFLCIISVSATRIYWYLAPAIPLSALLVAMPLSENSNRTFQYSWKLIIAAFMVWGYYDNYHHNTTAVGVSSAAVLLKAEKSGKLPFQAKWHVGFYHPIEKYYSAVLNRKRIALNLSSAYQYNKGDTLCVSNMAHLDTLNSKYFMRQHHYPTDEMPVWVMVIDSAKSH